MFAVTLLCMLLQFDEGDRYDSALMQEKLQGCDAWLCFDCDSTKIKEQVDVAKAAGIKSLVITSTMSAADAKAASVLEAFEVSFESTAVAIVDHCCGTLC
jgi:ABC-type sugar transport system substrate-binding protein